MTMNQGSVHKTEMENNGSRILSASADEDIQVIKDTLLSSMQMQNVVVLAGSGTSLKQDESGGPSMSDLWKLCTNKPDDNNIKSVFELINYNEENKNIEDLLSACESYLQIAKDEEKQSVENFINKCKDTILEKCRFEKSQDFLEGHKTFIHRLSRRRSRDTRLSIFTTNYDTAFEEAASALGVVVIDGLSFAIPRTFDPRFLDYDIVRRKTTSSNENHYLEGVFKLYKLHGSVNWQRESTGVIIESQGVKAEKSCMIFPARGKYQQSYIQPHLELMARYFAALREPNTCLLIVGFGFNDNHLSEPILSAIKSNSHLRVIVVDLHLHIKENGNDHIKQIKQYQAEGEDIFLVEGSFEKFSKLIPDLKALTPAEKIAQGLNEMMGGRK